MGSDLRILKINGGESVSFCLQCLDGVNGFLGCARLVCIGEIASR